MRKLITWVLGLPVAVLAVTFAVVNRAPAMVDLWPLPWQIQVPVYLLSLGTLGLGVLIGLLLALWTGGRTRARARAAERQARKLERRLAVAEEEQKAAPPAPSTDAAPAATGTAVGTHKAA